MEILNTLFAWIIKKRIHQIELFVKYPIDVQNEWLNKLLRTAQNTEWGKRYDFKSIKNYETFKNRIPLQDYETIKKDIIRIKHGEQNILWPSEIKWFAKSSGTSSDKSKFIPVSKESLEECHYKGGKDMLSLYYHNYPESRLFAGKALVVGGSRQINQFSSNSYYGDLSAIIMSNLPFWAEFRRVPKLTTALMDEWETKIEKMAYETADEDVTNISGVPSWTLVLLRKILEIKGKNDISEVWPNLELFIHGGVSFTPYRDQYKQLISSPGMRYLETYNASEGFFGIQDDLTKNEMLLMLDYGIFYEFIPMSDYYSDNPKVISLEDVDTEKDYAMIITTNGGLWRYRIGDTVRFTSVNPYKIIVSGRTKFYLNVFGEELMVHNVEQALKTACEKTGAAITDYTVAPVFMDGKQRGTHEWLIEFETEPDNFDFFKEILDNTLKTLNSDYEAKRYKNMVLDFPIIRKIPKNTFYNWMKQRGKLGGQNKVPRMSNERKYVESILQMLQNS
ncbi:MAG: hypothetical protein D6707_03585 [Bacteroidetes bacterium]|nr:MAG: hypothetical protein D6707_03585 [Bacteroidota bacterium]